MLPPEIVCAACHRGFAGHDRFGNCVALRRDYEPYSYRLTQRRILDANAERELTR